MWMFLSFCDGFFIILDEPIFNFAILQFFLAEKAGVDICFAIGCTDWIPYHLATYILLIWGTVWGLNIRRQHKIYQIINHLNKIFFVLHSKCHTSIMNKYIPCWVLKVNIKVSTTHLDIKYYWYIFTNSMLFFKNI